MFGTVISRVYDWFYYRPSATLVKVFRAALGLVSLGHILLFAPYLREFFTAEGWYPATYADALGANGMFSIFFYLPDTYAAVLTAFMVACLAAVALALSVLPNFTTILTFGFVISFTNRFPIAGYGGTQVLIILLFFAIFLPHTGWLGRKEDRLVEGWAFRLLQIQVAVIYLSSALSKIASPNWYGGVSMGNILHSNLSMADFSFISMYPWITGAITYGVLALELAFIFFCWRSMWHRRIIILLTASMHLGIMLTLNVTLFSPIMFVALTSFLKDEDLADLRTWWKARQARRKRVAA